MYVAAAAYITTCGRIWHLSECDFGGMLTQGTYVIICNVQVLLTQQVYLGCGGHIL